MSKKRLLSMCRFDFVSLPNSTIRTFTKNIYEVKSSLFVKDVETSQIKRIEDVYYNIRTVKDKDGRVIAKRKNRNQELFIVNR